MSGHLAAVQVDSFALPANTMSEVRSGEPRAVARASFDSIYAEYADFLWQSALSLGVRQHSVADVIQDVFVVVHRKLADFEGRSQLRTWLYGILLNVVRDHRRSLRRKPTSPLDEGELLSSEDPEKSLETRDELTRFNDALAALKEDERTFFVLLYVEEFSPKEVAELLSMTSVAVYSKARRVKESFETSLAKLETQELLRARKRASLFGKATR